MVKFLGCKKAAPLAVTRVGANPGAHVLIKKTKGAPAPESETTEMNDAEAAKAQAAAVSKILGMNDVTKAHYLALGEDAQVAFLAKTADEMNAEAATAKTAADTAAAAAVAAAAAATADTAAVAKSVTDLQAENAVLKARLDTADLEKRANTEFDGYPGGVDAVLPLLKAYAGLPEAARLASENVLKAQAKAALDSGVTVAKRVSNSAAAAATTQIEDAAKKLMDADPKKSMDDAIAEVTKSNPNLLLAGLEAEAQAQAAAA